MSTSAVVRSYTAELRKILRPRVVVGMLLLVVVAAIGGAAIVTASADPVRASAPSASVTVESLSAAGGGTEVFRTVASFAGVLVFVCFIGLIAAEFSRGTVRTMLLRQPRRAALLVGKVAAMLTFTAGMLAVGEIVTWLAARLLAPGQDIATGAWTSVYGLTAAVADYGAVVLWLTGYAVLGTAVAVVIRSVPVALAVGIAWAGPFEHLVQDAWSGASRLLPGLSLEAFVAGGNDDVGVMRALVMAALYVAIAATTALMVFAHRDVTS